MFTSINELVEEGQMLTINILKNGGKLTVAVLPSNVNDPTKTAILPLTLRGTAAELDAAFIASISQPLKQATGLLTNIEAFKQSLEKASKASKTSKEPKTSKSSPIPPKEASKTDKLLKEAEEFEKAGRFSQALEAYKEILEHDAYHGKANIKLKELSAKLAQTNLFAQEEIIEVPKANSIPNPAPETISSFEEEQEDKDEEDEDDEDEATESADDDESDEESKDVFAAFMGMEAIAQ